MTKNINFSIILFASFLLISQFFLKNLAAQQQNLSKYLHQSDEIEGWKLDDVHQGFKGEDLFLYINGGAEIYHEYGFKQVIVQDYKNKNGKSISVEIFEMTDTNSAYGIYTFKTNAGGKPIALGNEGCLENYYLNFWKGHFLVTITGFDQDKETLDGLILIAKAVDSKITANGRKPALFDLLPFPKLVQFSVKYFKGNLGLLNCYQFFTKNIFDVKEGIKADYNDGYTIYILKYNDEKESLNIFHNVTKNIKNNSKYQDSNFSDDGFHVTDNKDIALYFRPYKNYILILVGAKSHSKAKDILNNICKSKYTP